MKSSFRIATPVSHLFEKIEIKKKIFEFSDVLELRDNNIQIENEKPFIYHSDLNFVAKWSYSELKKLEEINNKFKVECVSYHLLSRYQKNLISNNAFIGVGQPLSISEMKNNIKDNLKITMEIFGYDKPILVENNNHLLTDAYDIVTDAEFIHNIVEENDIYLLLDLSHAKITSYNKKLDFDQYINSLPLDRCKQIHISRYSISNTMAIDSHNELKEDDWNNFKDLMKFIDSVEYVSIEYYRDAGKLLNQLTILKEMQQEFRLNNMLQIAKWDSEFFGFKVATLDSSDLNEELLTECIEKAKKENIKCIYCLSKPEHEELLNSVGFNQIDEKVEYAAEIKKKNKDEEIKIEIAEKVEVPEIKKIASSAFRGMSRFYRDHHFNQEKVDELYEKWIDKLINDPDSKILILRENNKIVAFNGISIKNGEGRIELIAVDEDSKKKGYGELLIKQAQKYFDKRNLKKKDIRIEGHRIYLRPLTAFDVTEKYYSWLNDPVVTKYIETKNATIEELKLYVKEKYINPSCLFLGIFLKKENIHIGNVKLEPIDFKQRKARLGLLIGDKEYWNKGYEAETYTILENYAFKNLKLIEIETGTYKDYFEDIKNLEKSGFSIYEEDENIYKMRVKVATQEINVPANKLYTKMGFINQDKKYWFHWWNEELING